MIPTFCKDCGKLVEWHPSVTGSTVSIDPEPHPEGTHRFAAGMRLQSAQPGSAKRMYRLHLRTCPTPGKAPRPAAFVCDFRGCEIEGFHRHCFRCSATDHFAADCPEDE